MKQEIKNPKNAVEYTMEKQWKLIMSLLKNIMVTKILVLKELDKIDCLYETVL